MRSGNLVENKRR